MIHREILQPIYGTLFDGKFSPAFFRFLIFLLRISYFLLINSYDFKLTVMNAIEYPWNHVYFRLSFSWERLQFETYSSRDASQYLLIVQYNCSQGRMKQENIEFISDGFE